MALSDAYGLAGHTMHAVPADDMGMQHDHEAMPMAGAMLAPVDTHALCQYADLFATLLLDIAPEQTSVARFDQPTQLSLTWTAAPATPALHVFSARGPPVA